MDTELARTFLAVVSAGNFVTAAEKLHVTQSTVSARIQTLPARTPPYSAASGCRPTARSS